MEYKFTELLLMDRDDDVEKRKIAASSLVDCLDHKNADECIPVILELTYDKNGYVRAACIKSLAKTPHWIKEQQMREVVKRLLMIGDIYSGYLLPKTLGRISEAVPMDMKKDVVVKLYSLLKIESSEMLFERLGTAVAGELQKFESLEDITVEMKKEAIDALSKYREFIPLTIEEGIIREIMDFLKIYVGWDIKYVIIEFIRGINPKLPENMRIVICDKILEFAADKDYLIKLNGIETIESLMFIVPPEIKEKVNKRVDEIVFGAVNSRDWRLKISAMGTAGKIFQSLSRDSRINFVRTILSSTRDPQWIVRMTVVKTLNQIKTGIPEELRSEIVREAITLMDDRDWSVRMFSTEFVGEAYNVYFPPQYRKEAMEKLLMKTKDSNRDVRDFARRAMEKIEQGA